MKYICKPDSADSLYSFGLEKHWVFTLGSKPLLATAQWLEKQGRGGQASWGGGGEREDLVWPR